MAQLTQSASTAKKAAARGGIAIAITFWSVPARAVVQRLWPCSATSVNWREPSRRGSPAYRAWCNREALALQPQDDIDGSFYVRFIVKDRAGIVGDIGQTFGGLGVNIAEIWQLRHSDDELQALARSYDLKENPKELLPFVITLERATMRQVRNALDSVRNRDYIVVDPVWFPIWGARIMSGSKVELRKMKFIILQGDGMADYPLEVLGGKTPLEAARTPNMDWLAARGVFGLAHVIPKGFPPGSDVGNMSIMGYDPAVYHTGRSPLEAASMGVALGPKDIAFRCNLVTFGGSGQ